MQKRTAILTLAAFAISCALTLACPHPARAGALENALVEWEPSLVQGTVMDVAGGRIAVAERWVLIVNTTIKGKKVQTRVVDADGNEIDARSLRRGSLVLARGGLAWDDISKGNVLVATEIRLLKKPYNLGSVGAVRELLMDVRPW